jgi:hypothetical protein
VDSARPRSYGISFGIFGSWGVHEVDLQSESMIMRNMPDIVQCIAFRRRIGLVIPAKQDPLYCVGALGFFCLLVFFLF